MSKQHQTRSGPEADPAILKPKLTAELPPFIVPKFAEKYLGSDAIAGITSMAATLEPYERYIVSGELPKNFVLEYLSATGELDHFSKPN
ncbi:MAG: hypothetical protein HYV33_01570 [Candidatus Kerfeldbacteria bacterium]|nr:hypothetical protein [Candidatus Kerfeldbacteria bacterium]